MATVCRSRFTDPAARCDVFIPPDAIEDAMHGDHVLAKSSAAPAAASVRNEPKDAIIRILDRAHPSIVGLFRYGPHGNTVLPYDVESSTRWKYTRQELTPGLWKKLGFSGSDETSILGRRIRAWTSLMGPW